MLSFRLTGNPAERPAQTPVLTFITNDCEKLKGLTKAISAGISGGMHH